jgi:Na+/H+-dicarboxylate symporter
VFLGEYASPFSVVGDVYIALLQMTVLPYIIVSLISNLGRITWAESRGLLLSAIWVLSLLLLVGMVMLTVIPTAFPDWQSASFFSSALVQPSRQLDIIALYIPANPFFSMANNVVPAVVLFSILLGVGISGVKGSEGFIQWLDVVGAGLNRINKLVIKLTPLGVLAIAAGTAGTISLDELNRMQAYLITYTVIALVLGFIVLPLLVSAVTPFSYRDLVVIPRDTLIMICAAAKIIVLMPQLVENVKELFRRYDLADEKVESGAEVLLPLAYPFPNLGTYTILMFVPFAAWYMGGSLAISDQLVFLGASLLSSFVAPITGIPFLLDLMQIPSDVMELFMMSTVYTDRIRVVLGAVHLLSLAVVVLAIRRGVFSWNVKALVRALLISFIAIAISLISVRAYLGGAMGEPFAGGDALVDMRWMEQTVPVKSYRDSLPALNPADAAGERLSRILQRGSLRVGYLADALPFAFSNSKGEIVGFDIEMAHRLAGELGVTLELIRTTEAKIGPLLQSGQLDIAMSGLAVTTKRALQWDFSFAPIDLTLAFLVPDYRRKEFADLYALRKRELRIGVVQADTGLHHLITADLPNATLVVVASPREFLRGHLPELDAVLYSAQAGAAWTLLYPAYTVAVPMPGNISLPMAYALPKSQLEWSRFVSEWVVIKRKTGEVNDLFDHWIKGKGAQNLEPRWSVIRNVLRWVD